LRESKNEKALILLLGGGGTRFGSSLPKQFYRLQDLTYGSLPLFAISCERLLNSISFNSVVFVVKKEYEKDPVFLDAKSVIETNHPLVKIYTTEGGKTRNESMRNGWKSLKKNHPHIKKIAVHDANRPFLSEDFIGRISENLEKLSETHTCFIPVTQATDSLCKITKGKVGEYINRSSTFQIQTPQLVWADALDKCVEKESNLDFSDEGSFLLSLNFEVYSYSGDIQNKKITFKEDIK